MEISKFENNIALLLNYVESRNYRGYDPYDALESPIFKLPFLKSNKIARFSFQQFLKRFPINLRQFFFIPRGYNPVTIGLIIQSYSNLINVNSDKNEETLKKIDILIGDLKKNISKNYSGACWGYDFDWESRYAKILAYEPTVVATGIITNSLFLAYKKTNNLELKKLIISAAQFVINDLNIYEKDDLICFSYSTNDNEKVFNASMKGARILIQAYSLSGDKQYLNLAKKAVKYVLSFQRKDGSWFYSLSNSGDWIDNYHTGYIVECLYDYQSLSKDYSFSENIKRGYNYYKNNFLTKEGIPKFYHNKIYPVDCTSASQFILTLTRFGDFDKAIKVSEWMVSNMQKKNGSFKFRKYKYFSINTSFMRWSNAWMLASFSYLFYRLNERNIK